MTAVSQSGQAGALDTAICKAGRIVAELDGGEGGLIYREAVREIFCLAYRAIPEIFAIHGAIADEKLDMLVKMLRKS